MSSPRTCRRTPDTEAGFTLPEALIALSLTLVVVGAGLSAFTNAMGLADMARVISDTNEGMQAAMSLMTRDLIQAGQSVPTGGIPIPTGAGTQAIVRPGPPASALTFPVALGVLPGVSPGGGLGPTIQGVQTDIVTILYADPTLALNQYPLVSIAADGSSMTVDNRTTISGADGIKVGDIILFSNANGNALQYVTRLNGTPTVFFDLGDSMRLNQRQAPSGSIMQIQAGGGAFPPTTATRIVMVSYYLDSTTDPTLPRLIRQVNDGARLAIALGTDNLQLTYDLVDGVTNPSNQENVVAPNSPNQIRKANLFLAGRSLDTNIHTKQYYRNSMATEVGFRSLSFVDRYK